MPSRSTHRAARSSMASVLEAVGDTPLVHLDRLFDRSGIDVWAKLESFNPSGSAKDRPALRMIEAAIDRGDIGPGSTVVESSSGNLGVALARACRYHGMRFVCVVDGRTNEVTIATMRALGAAVECVREPDPETGDLLVARLARVREILSSTPDAFWPNQYANVDNPDAHAAGTMREIHEALDGDVDVLLVATSTAGTIAGCQSWLREQGASTRVVAVDAVGSVLFGGLRAARKLPGFGAGMETDLSRTVEPDQIIRVTDLECVVGCRRLVDREAIFAGASGGGVIAALERLAPELEPGSRCAVVLHDGGGAYLDTVYSDEWVERELECTRDELAAKVRR